MDLNQTDSSLNSPSQEDLSSSAPDGDQLPSIADLEKMDKFRFEGQEWTAKDLKNAILRQQDYTKKTQAVAQEKKAFEESQKFYKNLYADLRIVEKVMTNNPENLQKVVQEFIKIYPQEFHNELRSLINGSKTAQPMQQQGQPQGQGVDIDTLNRLQTLEKFYHDQEVAKNEVQINSTIDKLSTKFPDAIPEMVIGRVFEAYSQLLQSDPNAKLTSQMWEDTFKTVDQFMKDRVNSMYKSKQQEQIKANKRASDVSAGGGTVGRAPQKFKRLKDVTAYAEKDITGQ